MGYDGEKRRKIRERSERRGRGIGRTMSHFETELRAIACCPSFRV
jgi:hypothetical protein